MDINWLNYYTGPNIPTLLIRIGPMGSGKTSAVNIFIEKHLKFLAELFYLVDIDNIVTNSKYYLDAIKSNPQMTSDELGALWYRANKKIKADEIMMEIINKLYKSKNHFSLESTGKYFCPSRKHILNSYKNGYSVIMVYCFLPFSILYKRVMSRMAQESRAAPISELIENIKSSLVNFTKNIPFIDNFIILDNSVDKNTSPNVLFESNINFDKFDNDSCLEKKYTQNKDRIDYLKNLITTDSFYDSYNNIKTLELAFLDTILNKDIFLGSK
tara:strand:- start:54 stop:866 length:813 start_codon:yes stop_codon:yes gene_type:complete